jgi:hypothetical protein
LEKYVTSRKTGALLLTAFHIQNDWKENTTCDFAKENVHNYVSLKGKCWSPSPHGVETAIPFFMTPTENKASGPVVLENNRNMAEQLESVSDAIRDQHPNPGPNTDTNPGRNNTTSTPADTHGARSRRKRFLSYPRYVELMVTADAKMVRHHGRNLEHYILTIMSVVSKMMFLF